MDEWVAKDCHPWEVSDVSTSITYTAAWVNGDALGEPKDLQVPPGISGGADWKQHCPVV